MNSRRTALAIAVLLGAITGAAAAADATVPAKNGRIAFIRFGLGIGVQASEIYGPRSVPAHAEKRQRERQSESGRG